MSANDRHREFRDRLHEVRAALRAATVADVDRGRVARAANFSLAEALNGFGPQQEGTPGAAWATLAERAARQLDLAAELADIERQRALINEAEGLIATALGERT